MASLAERYRPRKWADVVGQDKALAKIETIRRNGLGGRFWWIAGQSGTGKTSIAMLLALELADELCIEEYDGGELTEAMVREISRRIAVKGMGKGGRAIVVNEAHGLKKGVIRALLTLAENGKVPDHAAWIFTTTNEGQDRLFEDFDDSSPLLSRASKLFLSRRDLARPFAERCKAIAEAEGLDGQPIERYVRLAQEERNNLRAMLSRVEAGEMIGGGA